MLLSQYSIWATCFRLAGIAFLLYICTLWYSSTLRLTEPAESTQPIEAKVAGKEFAYDVELPPYEPVIDFLEQTSLRPLVLYAYAESATARADLEFFVAKGLNAAADFIFIFNGNTSATQLIPERDNIRIIERENRCFDLGVIGRILRGEDLVRKYRRFITLNASIRGSFLPTYAQSNTCWMDAFLDRITDTTKLVGMTLNCLPRPHVQSMIWATDNIGMGILNNAELITQHDSKDIADFETPGGPVGLSVCYDTMPAAVHAEIGGTEVILGAGYKVDVMMTAYAPYSGRSPREFCEDMGRPNDFLYKDKYFGGNIHPYETIFVKANRDIDPEGLQHLTDWHLAMTTSSWDSCERS